MSELKGRFVWYEYMVEDVDAGIACYGDLVGWGTQPFGDAQAGMPPYTMFTIGGQPIGGTMRLSDEAKAMGAPPHFLGYVGTPDVDATVVQATELGATVYVPPADIPLVGRFAVLADPQGAVQAVFQPAGDPPPGVAAGTRGSVAWHELLTDDLDKAFDYYAAIHGWEKTESMDMGDLGLYQMYGHAGQSYGGMMTKPPEMAGTPSAWLYYLTVDDLDATLAKMTGRGGKLMNGPMEVPGGGRVAQCVDPQGAAVAFFCGQVTA